MSHSGFCKVTEIRHKALKYYVAKFSSLTNLFSHLTSTSDEVAPEKVQRSSWACRTVDFYAGDQSSCLVDIQKLLFISFFNRKKLPTWTKSFSCLSKASVRKCKLGRRTAFETTFHSKVVSNAMLEFGGLFNNFCNFVTLKVNRKCQIQQSMTPQLHNLIQQITVALGSCECCLLQIWFNIQHRSDLSPVNAAHL